MATYFAHGASGAVGIQGYAAGAALPSAWVTLKVKEWEGTLTKAEHDTSNTSVTGWTATQPGKATLSFSIKAQLELTAAALTYNQGTNPIGASGPDLQAEYCSVKLIGGTTSIATAVSSVTAATLNNLFDCPTAVVTSIKITNQEGNIIDYEIVGKSSGTVVINGAS